MSETGLGPATPPPPVDDNPPIEDEQIDVTRAWENLRNITTFVSGDGDKDDEEVKRSVAEVESHFKRDLALDRMAYTRYQTARRMTLLQMLLKCEREINKRQIGTMEMDELIALRKDTFAQLQATSESIERASLAPVIQSNMGKEVAQITDEQKAERASLDVLRQIFELAETEIRKKVQAQLTDGTVDSTPEDSNPG